MNNTTSDSGTIKILIGIGIAAGVLLALLFAGGYLITENGIRSNQTSAAIINVSGRQRMLSQRIADISNDLMSFPEDRDLSRQRLLQAVDLMEASHKGLLHGDKGMHLPTNPSKNISRIMFEPPYLLDQRMKAFVAAARALAKTPDSELNTTEHNLQHIHMAAGESLLQSLDVLTNQFQSESEAAVAELQYRQKMILGAQLVLLLLLGLLIFLPLVRRVVREIRESARLERHVSNILENMVDGVISINEHGMVQSYNNAAENIFGYRADEVVGSNVNMLMPEPYKSSHDGFLQHYLKTGERKIIGIGREVTGRRKDGSIFPMELAVGETTFENNCQFIGTVRNISERKAAEEKIDLGNRELEIRGRYDQSYAETMALFSSTHDQQKALDKLLAIIADNHPVPASAIYIYDEWSGALKLSASYGAPESITRSFDRGEGLIGQAALDNKPILLHDIGEDDSIIIEAGVLSFKPSSMAIHPICYQDKVLGVLVLASSQPLSELDQSFIERLSVQLGVAMNNLSQHSDLVLLAEQLKQRGEEVTRQNQQLEQASRMKSEFLANMSHELRTPLNAIIGFSEVLKDGVMGELEPEQEEYVSDIFTSGQHLLSLINDILDLSKIEAGKMELDAESVDVAELLENSLSVVKEKAMAHRIKLTLEVGDDVDVCALDARKTKQIVFNLLSNAVKFTPDAGKVSVQAKKIKGSELASRSEEQPAPMSSMPSLEGDFLEISVADTGIGISEEDQAKLFQAFVQADSSLARKYEGTGLGLVMVRRLAQLHGGDVCLRSKEGEGSTFTVWLPWRSPDETSSGGSKFLSASLGPRKAVSGNQLVMIVEDEDASAELMRVQLEENGYKTCRAASGEEAFEMLAETRPDLITLDIIMPGMDGWDFLAQLKNHKDYSRIPVAIVSIVADENKGFTLGASQVLSKPVRKADLLAALQDIGTAAEWADKKIKALVVDDDIKAVEVVSRHMQSEKCSVIKAYGGREAIDSARKNLPDIIILDLMMPDVTGFDVVEAMKSDASTASIPIVILTAKVITETDRKKLNGDVMKIVEKSHFNHGSFIGEIQRAIGARSATAGKQKEATESGGEREIIAPAPVAVKDNPLVLVAEDNRKESDLLKRYLESAGCRVVQASNGVEALAMMTEEKPDLITLDITMPEMDGFTFLNEKAKQQGFASIPVMIVSGVDESESGLSLGANAILRKPFKKQDFLEVTSSLGIFPNVDDKPTVLVVDDDPNAVKIMGSYFSADSYQVIKTYGGREGLAAAQKSIPDMIVLDLMMPEMNGFEVIEHLKRDENTKHIPVIVVTAKVLTTSERQELAEKVQAIREKARFSKQQFLDEANMLLRRNLK